jgi:2-keto-4-pentenoate hydratase
VNGIGSVYGPARPRAADPDVDRAVVALQTAYMRARPCAPVRGLVPDQPSAYAVQDALVQARRTAGSTVVGRKVGLANPTVQARFGAVEPLFGTLFDDMRRRQQQPIDTAPLIAPRIELEIAFVLAYDVESAVPLTGRTVRPYVDHACAALEIVDSRIDDWDLTTVDAVADNGCSALFVLGDDRVPLDALDPSAVTAELWRHDEVVSVGHGANSSGDPLRTLAWLATVLQQYGQPLRRGDVVLSGALAPRVHIGAGDRFVGHIDGLGSVAASFD